MGREKAKRKKGDNGVPVSYLNGTVVDWKKNASDSCSTISGNRYSNRYSNVVFKKKRKLTLLNPMSWDFSRKHCLQMFICNKGYPSATSRPPEERRIQDPRGYSWIFHTPYLRMRPPRLEQTRLFRFPISNSVLSLSVCGFIRVHSR